MSKILFIVEGAKDEPRYIEQFISYHKETMEQNGNDVSPIIVQSYGTLIYDLYKKISDYPEDDEFETIPVLLEILKSKSIEYSSELEDYEKFSDIFLFFDLDAHYHARCENPNDVLYEKMQRLLSLFKESTEKGKLLISYPMFEALKCFKDDYLDIVGCKVFLHLFNIYDVGNKCRTTFKKKYKTLTCDCYNNPSYDKSKIENLVKYFIFCSLFLVENKDEVSNSKTIFLKQYEKYIKPNNSVVILSAFPHFIVEIFGTTGFFEGNIEPKDMNFEAKALNDSQINLE